VAELKSWGLILKLLETSVKTSFSKETAVVVVVVASAVPEL
jgi:hypothetical protein